MPCSMIMYEWWIIIVDKERTNKDRSKYFFYLLKKENKILNIKKKYYCQYIYIYFIYRGR